MNWQYHIGRYNGLGYWRPNIYVIADWSSRGGHEWYALGESGWEKEKQAACDACELAVWRHYAATMSSPSPTPTAEPPQDQ